MGVRLVAWGVGLALVAASLGSSTSAAPPDPLVSVWYRGRPAGVPHAEDLAELRDAGFSGVTWPVSSTVGMAELTRLAEQAGLAVVLRPDDKPLTPLSALKPGDRPTLLALPAAMIAPIAWRAVGHGARVLSLDAGQAEGAGLTDPATGKRAGWVVVAAAMARQFRVNGALIGELGVMPPVLFERPPPPTLDVVLLEARKSWVVVATNAGGTRIRAVVRLPHDVPYAIWLNLLNGATLSMLAEPTGPKWNLDLEAYAARVYVIDKTLR